MAMFIIPHYTIYIKLDNFNGNAYHYILYNTHKINNKLTCQIFFLLLSQLSWLNFKFIHTLIVQISIRFEPAPTLQGFNRRITTSIGFHLICN